MKIRLLKQHHKGKVGDIVEKPDSVARYVIKIGVAEPVEEDSKEPVEKILKKKLKAVKKKK